MLSDMAGMHHTWHFTRSGGLDQVALQSTEDLLALPTLDPKLWVALSCPAKGLELDPRTLALLDTDNDGHVRVPEVLAAVAFVCARLKDPSEILRQRFDDLPLDRINDATPEGRIILTAVKTLPAKSDKLPTFAETAADELQRASKGPLKGDGVLRSDAGDKETQQLIQDIAATHGPVNEDNTAAFFADLEAFQAWSDSAGAVSVEGLGPAAAEAFAAVDAVRGKVEDYFARCALAAFDVEAVLGLNRNEDDYRAIAGKQLSGGSPEVAAIPLARIEANRPLPLVDGINPAWAGAIARLHMSAIVPVLGPRTELTFAEWTTLANKLKPFENWVGTKPTSSVAKLGIDRIKEILASEGRKKVAALFAEDTALKPRVTALDDVQRLSLYCRELGTLLHNFINFRDFYSRDKWAVFQAGILFLDSRGCKLCIRVQDVASHAANAGMSGVYVAYLEIKRAGEVAKVAACFTQGDSDYLFVGRNGIFYDRLGRDWEATIIKIIESPISIRQSFFAPYKRVAAFVESQFSKFAASKDLAVTSALNNLPATAISTPTAAPATAAPGSAAPASGFDIAKFAGIFAAIGLALGAIGGAITSVAKGFFELQPWEMPLAVIAALLIVSGPSMILAALRLRQRNLGPLLEATGWAVNGRVKINFPLGVALTDRASIPIGARHLIRDPYADKSAARQRAFWIVLFVLAIVAVVVSRFLGTWPFHHPLTTPITATPVTPVTIVK
jgi:hypothetical protein